MTIDSLAERVLWKKLQHRALAGFRFLRRPNIGPFPWTFYCPKARLAVDLRKDTIDARLDSIRPPPRITVLRFSNLDVYRNRDNVLQAIALALPRAKQNS